MLDDKEQLRQPSLYDKHWHSARAEASTQGLQIIEHGWEQHVIINQDLGTVYRYPRNRAAAAKLDDEVGLLDSIHKQEWPVQLPKIIDHTPSYTSYRYIPGEVLDNSQINLLADQDFDRIGRQLGDFLSHLHKLDPSIIRRKETRHDTTLLEYYTERIESAKGQLFYGTAAKALSKLGDDYTGPQVVVHGDLHGLNMVIDPKIKSLNGVIDLSEMEVGDPHQDFRKLFMTDPRLLDPAIAAYDKPIDAKRVKDWAYVNEWANLCFFADDPNNPTYQRAYYHLVKWRQL